MTDKEYLRRLRTLRLMKRIAEMRIEHAARDANVAATPPNQSPEWNGSLQRLKKLAAELDCWLAGQRGERDLGSQSV